MDKIVSVHHVDKDAFLKGNIEHDPEEVVLVFDRNPNYAEVVEKVRIELNWMDPNDVVELEGRHNVGSGMHSRWKVMHLNSESRWSAYKEIVAESQDKARELFATKKVDPRLHFDLNRCASQGDVRSPVQNKPLVDHEVYDTTSSPPPMTQHEMTQPTMTQHEISPPSSPNRNEQFEALEEESDDYEDDKLEDELHNNDVGDVEAYCLHEDMDHDIPYNRCTASDSDDDGPEEDVDEDGFTAKEVEAFKKVVGRDHRTSLFHDLSLADKAVVDGGTCKLLGPRSTSKKDMDPEKYGIGEG